MEDRSHHVNATDESKSLLELEALQDLGEPEYQSYVVTNAHRLYLLPLREFTDEDLRFMIGQQCGLPFLIPLALDRLRADLFIEGDCYCGALLAAVLQADSRFWISSPSLRAETADVAQQALSAISALSDPIDRESAQESLRAAHDIFQRAEYFAEHGRA